MIAGSGRGPFLRTGDLGFFHEDELFITGRLKDLIIIRGRNHYPQDIELTVEQSHEAFEPSMGAAFSIDVDGEEQLVVTYEAARKHRKADIIEVAAAARRAVAENHQLRLYSLALLKPMSIPKTSSGKVKRHACRLGYLDGSLSIINLWTSDELLSQPAAEPVEPAAEPVEMVEARTPGLESFRERVNIERWLVERVATLLKVAPFRIDVREPFAYYGLDSAQAVELAGDLESWLGRTLSPTLVWDYPNIAELSAHLAGANASTTSASLVTTTMDTFSTDSVVVEPVETDPIVVVGLSCRFPGAEDAEAFWQNLVQGVDSITEVPADRWTSADFYDEAGTRGKMTTKWGGFLDNIDQFDPKFFGISPREASRMDPQQRLLLEVTWEALENAGQNPDELAGSRTGVYVGISSYDYSHLQFSSAELIDAYAGTGNAHSIASNRLSYVLDLQGPSMAIDTACSSSLVAIHQAIRSLRSGESDMALAGGVNLLLAPELTIAFSQARMMAGDGRCKTFDARADGYVRGEGCGMVVLKRLSDAERHGDPILAVLMGSAVNQDGRSNGLTAPNGRAQQAVIRSALVDAGLKAADIDYIEAHGTGTPLGDPIEIASLRAVLDAHISGSEGRSVQLGSVKTNIGHLEAAAGIAGVIKVILALQHGRIPPHLNYTELNPYIDL
jgi:3-oxoacyl-(acyl-carrier-protein) synthase/acyl carrier protein